jgi:hypothetical protein
MAGGLEVAYVPINDQITSALIGDSEVSTFDISTTVVQPGSATTKATANTTVIHDKPNTDI